MSGTLCLHSDERQSKAIRQLHSGLVKIQAVNWENLGRRFLRAVTARCPNLEGLWLTGTEIEDDWLEELQLPNLTHLYLNYCKKLTTLPKTFDYYCPRLITLNTSFTNINVLEAKEAWTAGSVVCPTPSGRLGSSHPRRRNRSTDPGPTRGSAGHGRSKRKKRAWAWS